MNTPQPTDIPACVPTLPSGPNQEFLSFRLGAEEYGIDIFKVQEIRGYDQPTRMANAPGFIKGVTNLRGVIVPIIDMRIKFGLTEVRYDAMTVTVVLNIADRVFGIVVDAVCDVIELAATDIKPLPAFSETLKADFLIGMGAVPDSGRDRDRALILLDIEKLMTSADMGLVPTTLH